MNGRNRYPGGSAYAAEQLAYGAIQPSLVLIAALLLTRATFGELGQAVTVATAGLVAVRSVYGTSILVGRQPPVLWQRRHLRRESSPAGQGTLRIAPVGFVGTRDSLRGGLRG